MSLLVPIKMGIWFDAVVGALLALIGYLTYHPHVEGIRRT
jgi:hypothetical protein